MTTDGTCVDLVRTGCGELLADWTRHVTDADRQRADRFLDEGARTRALLRAACVRAVLAFRTGVSPAQVRLTRRCAGCGGTDHGRPLLAGWGVSVSHTQGWTVVAVRADADLGVDVERVDASAGAAGLPVFGPAERRRLQGCPAPARDLMALRFWTVKEAVLKRRGTGLTTDPAQVDCTLLWPLRVVSVPAPPGLVVSLDADGPARCVRVVAARDLLGSGAVLAAL